MILSEPDKARAAFSGKGEITSAFYPEAELRAGACPVGMEHVGPGGECQEKPDLPRLAYSEYDKILVAFSGGKDSVACALALYERLVDEGVDPRKKMELWHHNVDGSEDQPVIWDWPCTESYCRAFAEHLGVPFLLQYRKGGIHREMWRTDQCSEAVHFQTWEDGQLVWRRQKRDEERCSRNTRRRFPQVTANLATRWCTAYVKIMVAESAITNDERFDYATYTMVSGERREESNNRSKYAGNEEHRTNTAHRPTWNKVYEVRFLDSEGRPLKPGKAGRKKRVDFERHSAIVHRALGLDPEIGVWLFAREDFAKAARSQLVERVLTAHDEYETSRGKKKKRIEKEAKANVAFTERWELVENWTWGKVKSGKDPAKVRRGTQRTQRYADQYRPVIDWLEEDVWEIMRRWGIVPHPCYWLGYSRASCMTCIFLRDTDLTNLRQIDPERFELHVKMEKETGYTVDREISLTERANQGQFFVPQPGQETYSVLDHNKRVRLGRTAFEELTYEERHVQWPRSIYDYWEPVALSRGYTGPIYTKPDEWYYPAGAFRHSGGPD